MPGEFQSTIVQAKELGSSEYALWAGLRALNPALRSPFFAPEFTKIAADIVPHAYVAIVTRDQETVGFFPFQRRGQSAYPIGGPLNDLQSTIAAPHNTPSLGALFGQLDIKKLALPNWIGSAESCIEHQTLLAVLPDGDFEAWYAAQYKQFARFFKDKQRGRRNLEASLGPLQIQTGLKDATILDRLIDLKRAQYQKTGHHDVFSCGWTREFLHALMQSEGSFGAAIAMKSAGGQPISYEYSLFDGDHYHFWFPAYEAQHARSSPGILLTLDTMRALAPQGFHTFNFGQRGAAYKNYFCNNFIIVREVTLKKPSNRSVVAGSLKGLANHMKAGLGDALSLSLRRRWASIEACETTMSGRAKGIAKAVGSLGAKLVSAARTLS